MRVSVLDIEPIEPATGGSRLRLKGLYHALGEDIDVTYVGAYHWRGESFRRIRHGPRFEEITVPFSDRHLNAAAVLQANAGGYDIIDSSFPLLGGLSPEYRSQAVSAARTADVVVVSHPWAYCIIRDVVDHARQLLVYDAHNVETALKRDLLGESKAGQMICDAVERLEGELCRKADLIAACSHHDRRLLAATFGVALAKIRVAPNGAFTKVIAPVSAGAKLLARLRLGLGGRPVVLFIGGFYPPNVEAAEFICDELAPRCPGMDFVIVGNAGGALHKREALPKSVRVTGAVDEATKRRWLAASDVGINPMFSGSGTNIKMVEYMAAGLAVVSTPFGARGLESANLPTAETADGFAASLRRFDTDRVWRGEAGRRNRAVARREFDWRTISVEFGATLANHKKRFSSRAPFFSVAIPTFERPEKLRRLLDLLSQQRERDFEVIVVDQSDVPFQAVDDYGYDLTILHSRVRGQAHARNVAACVARGTVIACTDDDCEPGELWLASARPCFDDTAVVGVEGRCFSDHRHDAAWRTVDNYGIEGVGFMTCNLFVTTEAFHAIGGFDFAFDERQFRYDTDFGWRLQTIGKVPFCEAAFVYHPPWRRALARESVGERALLFEADALLLRKHPDRYRELFLREHHWEAGKQFSEPFLRGARRLDVRVPDYVREKFNG